MAVCFPASADTSFSSFVLTLCTAEGVRSVKFKVCFYQGFGDVCYKKSRDFTEDYPPDTMFRLSGTAGVIPFKFSLNKSGVVILEEGFRKIRSDFG